MEHHPKSSRHTQRPGGTSCRLCIHGKAGRDACKGVLVSKRGHDGEDAPSTPRPCTCPCTRTRSAPPAVPRQDGAHPAHLVCPGGCSVRVLCVDRGQGTPLSGFQLSVQGQPTTPTEDLGKLWATPQTQAQTHGQALLGPSARDEHQAFGGFLSLGKGRKERIVLRKTAGPRHACRQRRR